MREEELRKAGINYEEGLNRFMGNPALFERFLYKFPQDETMGELRNCMEKKDVEGAFRAAHTLKGVTGNLSMERLYQQFSSITESLRMGNYEEAAEKMPALEGAYQEVVQALS